MGAASEGLGVYEIADREVNIFLRRNPGLEYLRDDLVSSSYVAIAERPDATDTQLANAVNSVIRDVVTRDIQYLSRSQNRTRKAEGEEDKPVVCLKGEPIGVDDDGLRELMDCCSTPEEETIMRMRWYGITQTQIAAQLEIPLEDVEAAIQCVADRFFS